MTCEQRGDARGRSVLFTFFAGALVGAGVGLLLAPRRGSEIRKMMAESAEELRSRASETLEQSQDQASRVVERGREMYHRARDLAIRSGQKDEEASGDVAGHASEATESPQGGAGSIAGEPERFS